jgi:hypothetical protein
MGGGGVRRGNVTTTWEGRDEWPELSVDTADSFLMARYGTTAPQQRGTARRLLDDERRRTAASQRRVTARARRRWIESAAAMGGDGRRDGELTVMDGAALR